MLMSMLPDDWKQKSTTNKRRLYMISKLILALVFVALFSLAGGFVALAAWDVPVTQTPVEKVIDNSRFLEKSS